MKFFEFIESPAAAVIVAFALCAIALAFVIVFRIESNRRRTVRETCDYYEAIIAEKDAQIAQLEADKLAIGAKWFAESMAHKRTAARLSNREHEVKQLCKADRDAA